MFPLNLYARVRISLCINAHETAGAARTRSSPRPLLRVACALLFWGRERFGKPRAMLSRERRRMSVARLECNACKTAPNRFRHIPVVTGVGRCHVAGEAALHTALVQLRKCLILHCNKTIKSPC